MTEADMLFSVTVPGSTANLGPGFDSVGMALSRYLRLSVFPHDEWRFEAETEVVAGIPEGTDNLIYQVAKRTAAHFGKDLPPSLVKVWSDIPLARGLGSSAAAIAAAIELANELADLKLSDREKLHFASLEEGHPDNAGASLFGGLVIGLHEEDETEMVSMKDIDLDVVVVIPFYEVLTKDARDVLPESLSYPKAVEASAVSNMLVAGLMAKDWKLVGRMMQKDLFHQPYRRALVPELSKVEHEAGKNGAFGTALSGAGPTILSFIEKGKGDALRDQLASKFPHCEVDCLHVPDTGIIVERKSVNSV
ncbi:homoserine kinase [Bacillus paralicheniformis]|jgi:homoserine kinase|uniref:Homoserine kinase n=1 Tax=Bacillus paralicheniformis TaxID=1648923 RepID=A0A6N2H113_9BACI|nr:MULTISPECIES: homoserine kinase [Bacillus]KJD54030.1 serine kinase [Bacillus amyloliquefaciens]KUL09977.1 homoserine kinase [Bacillus licheniformis LMG 7559]MBC8621152.1 homoserine kinase [Robertmurraya crescens]AGN37795.1 homoserine kinase ThrB [Bacillus paralicheniformis ATCC 9945a]AJO19833.1 homoserine kinase [Bacillus paralicheniformis]